MPDDIMDPIPTDDNDTQGEETGKVSPGIGFERLVQGGAPIPNPGPSFFGKGMVGWLEQIWHLLRWGPGVPVTFDVGDTKNTGAFLENDTVKNNEFTFIAGSVITSGKQANLAHVNFSCASPLKIEFGTYDGVLFASLGSIFIAPLENMPFDWQSRINDEISVLGDGTKKFAFKVKNIAHSSGTMSNIYGRAWWQEVTP